jgi:hypothetical protein
LDAAAGLWGAGATVCAFGYEWRGLPGGGLPVGESVVNLRFTAEQTVDCPRDDFAAQNT